MVCAVCNRSLRHLKGQRKILLSAEEIEKYQRFTNKKLRVFDVLCNKCRFLPYGRRKRPLQPPPPKRANVAASDEVCETSKDAKQLKGTKREEESSEEAGCTLKKTKDPHLKTLARELKKQFRLIFQEVPFQPPPPKRANVAVSDEFCDPSTDTTQFNGTICEKESSTAAKSDIKMQNCAVCNRSLRHLKKQTKTLKNAQEIEKYQRFINKKFKVFDVLCNRCRNLPYGRRKVPFQPPPNVAVTDEFCEPSNETTQPKGTEREEEISEETDGCFLKKTKDPHLKTLARELKKQFKVLFQPEVILPDVPAIVHIKEEEE